MCGIAGFLKLQSDAISFESAITSISKTLSHRGPDDAGVWFDDSAGIALGHRRLSIIDLSQLGHQPMHSQCGRYVIVYNGEIYNFVELRVQLTQKNHHFIGHSDTEVILALIIEFGLEKALQAMSGMFAFALWDKQEKVLHLARDRIGEKPLYYGFVNNTLIFASELKAISCYPGFNSNIARESLSLLLGYGYIPAPHSIYENIFKLMPATYLTISAHNFNRELVPKAYWSATDVAYKAFNSPLQINDHDAIEKTDLMLNSIVKSRMVSDVPVGAFLSGGIDSSLVATLMRNNSAHPIKTFTIGFDDALFNEAKYAKIIADYIGTEHTELYIDSSHALAVIPKLSRIYDEPFADSSAIPTYLVSELTRQQVKVCLSGDGGDEVFGGYGRYSLGKSIWKKLVLIPYPLRSLIQKTLQSVPSKNWDRILSFINLPKYGDKLHKLATTFTASSPEMFYYLLFFQNQDIKNAVLNPVSGGNPYQWLPDNLPEIGFVEKMMLFDTVSYLPDDIMVKVDRAAMAVSLESRAPYLDHQLIEFIWSLPLRMKIRGNKSKWILRQVLNKYIPSDLMDRPKMGFAVPLEAWLRGPLRDWAENLLNKSIMNQQGFLNTQLVHEKWQEHLSGHRNWERFLWAVLMFQSWLEKTRRDGWG